MGNVASILQFNSNLDRNFTTFKSSEESVYIPPKDILPYFL